MKQFLSNQFVYVVCSLMFLVVLITAENRNQNGGNGQEDPCTLPPVTGLCLAYFPSFYYDARADKCMPFVYGGCGGNSNRFPTENECGKFRQQCLRNGGKYEENNRYLPNPNNNNNIRY